MSFNISKLSDNQLAQLCIKHKIIERDNFSNYTRNQVVKIVNKWCQAKKQKNKGQNLNQTKSVVLNQSDNQRQRRNIPQINIKNKNDPPNPTMNRRRMSDPLTIKKKFVLK